MVFAGLVIMFLTARQRHVAVIGRAGEQGHACSGCNWWFYFTAVSARCRAEIVGLHMRIPAQREGQGGSQWASLASAHNNLCCTTMYLGSITVCWCRTYRVHHFLTTSLFDVWRQNRSHFNKHTLPPRYYLDFGLNSPHSDAFDLRCSKQIGCKAKSYFGKWLMYGNR